MKKLRVLLVSHTCQSVSEGQRKPQIISGLGDIEIKVLVPDRWKHYGRWRKADVSADDALFQVERVCWPWMGPAQFYLHWYPKLKSILRSFRPEVIDLWEEPWGLVSAHTVRLRNTSFPKTKIISETEQNLNRHLPVPFETFRRYTLRNADFLIGRSLEAIEVARLKGYRGPASTVPNAVDSGLFQPMDRIKCRQKLGWNANLFIAGYVGRLVERKGLADLIAAIEKCPSQLAVAFVGDGEMSGWLQQQALRPELHGRVLLLAGMPLDDLPLVMNALDVLALPSRTVPTWKEQFGRVLIEANACGVPVIGSNSGAIPEVIEDGGLVFSEGNIDELVNALMKMSADRDLCKRLGEAGLAQVYNKYTWQRVAEKMAEIYRRVGTQ